MKICEKCYDTGYIACGKVHGTNELIVKPCPHCKIAKQLLLKSFRVT